MGNRIKDNVNAINHSFLYYLHEENKFDEESFTALCNDIEALDKRTVLELDELRFIQIQTLEHIIYHFDPSDMSTISNLPKNYLDFIECLDIAISKTLKK